MRMEPRQFRVVSAAAASSGTTFPATKAVLVTVAGTATVTFEKDSSTTALTGLLAGIVYPFSITGFTSGTASLVLLY